MKIRYRPSKQGTRALAQSEPVGVACLEGAQRIEAAAKLMPVIGARNAEITAYRARFGARRVDVKMSESGEKRAGAIVFNDHELEHVFGGRSRVLYSAVQALQGVVIQ